MLEWIIGALGASGIAAAIAFVPGAKAIALQFIGFVAELVRRYPWQCAVIAALCWGAWQCRRAEAWHDHSEREAANHRETKDLFADARREWLARTVAATKARMEAERKSKETAHDAQAQYEVLLADNDGLRDYIAAHRLRDGRRQERPLPATGADEDHAAGVPAGAAPGALVAVSEADLERCDADYSYAAAAHQWAQGLINQNLAETAP
ncbi:hypothetical protein GCM10011349_19990 [Novosphingobium indicum]|uniref:Uncharacterized protein n=1 Tax=Novosphingobium indicum TaxID=462949 RepID=A0ABQ2JK08_9SPHN|nr:hypothetical protein [Novosphingobium indicum]GGN49390.1 hypothetical protein GCM10011349_19990 [Novosphingobium indicum]